jgi:DNA processing protein
MTQTNLPYWLAALYLPGIGPRTFLRWLDQFTDIKALFHASDDEMHTKGIPDQHRKSLQHTNWKQIEDDLAWAQADNHHIICLEDEDYPRLLKEISDPPLILFVKGNKQALSETQIAMVGARNATHAGLKNAEHFAYSLSKAGFVITSGLARGIDGASHRGTLAAQGVTIGVCGTGLQHVYPLSHRSLAENMIQQGGAILSEFPLGMLPRAENFPRRNRVIGGLSVGVLVVEAALKSGSLITARFALEQGREVFAIPGSIHQTLSRGCHHLIRQGAKLVESAEDIFEELRGLRLPLPKKPVIGESLECLTPSQQQLLKQIEYEITPMDMILLRSGLTAGEVSSILLILELNGYIQSVPGGYIREILNQ